MIYFCVYKEIYQVFIYEAGKFDNCHGDIDGGHDDGGEYDDPGDDERQEVSVTHCWLSLALCLTGCF